MVSEPAGAAAEAIRALRTHLMAQHIQQGRRALAICAASTGVGCTFVAANLATGLAQVGIKTLLIDANMRDPGVNKLIPPVREGPGLTQCLASHEVGFADAVQDDVLPHLSVIYAGSTATSGQELLAGQRFKDLMDFCLRDFDVTIIDTPAANTSADARRISTVVGYGLIVARRDKSLIHDVKVLDGQLRDDHARVVGAVLNQI